MIRVAVIGAAGRMGGAVRQAVRDDPELELVAAVVRPDAVIDEEPDVPLVAGVDGVGDLDPAVAVDFTTPATVMGNVRWLVRNGIHAVVGTSGIGTAELEQIREWLEEGDGRSNVVVAPNFAVGAVLLQRFAAEAARFFPAAEVIELHHPGKLDAPSGTALATAERMAAARSEAWEGPLKESVQGVRGGDVEGIRVHSVRLPGLVAHQEVVFGGPGQTLTLRHDSLDRSSFMPGVLLAIKRVAERPGLTVGLEPLLGLAGDVDPRLDPGRDPAVETGIDSSVDRGVDTGIDSR